MKTRILVRLLALLGFGGMVSCEIVTAEMYASPSAAYEIKGKVTTSSNNPIKGIQVTATPTIAYFLPQTALTDANGDYNLSDRGDGVPNDIAVRFEDIDGEENGGEFIGSEESVHFANGDFKGGKNFYRGKATKTVNTRLFLTDDGRVLYAPRPTQFNKK